MLKNILLLLCLTILNIGHAHAEINENAELVFKINLTKKPTTRPQTVAYVPGEKKYSMAYISLNSGHNKVLNKHDELRLIINKENDNDITFNKPDNSKFTHGKINLVNEDIVLILTKNLKSGKHMEVLSIPFITNINSKNTLGDLTESLSIQLPLQGNPKINIENGIMKVEPIKISYQRYEDLIIKFGVLKSGSPKPNE